MYLITYVTYIIKKGNGNNLISFIHLQNWEFQYYNNNRTNSFAHSGILFIRPSLSSDQFGNSFLHSGRLNIEGGAPADR